MPSTPSQKSIEVCRSAPTIVMWWTPWLWSLRMGEVSRSVFDERRFVLAALQRAPWHELHAGGDHERGAQPVADGVGEGRVGPRVARELDGHRQRRLLLDPRRGGADEDVAAHVGREAADDLADRRREDVHAADDQHVVGAADAAHARPGPPARAR